MLFSLTAWGWGGVYYSFLCSSSNCLGNQPKTKLLEPRNSSLLFSVLCGLRSLLLEEPQFPLFRSRIKAFFYGNSSSSGSCKFRFFMTWISPLKAFGVRELLSVESMFKSHREACLVIVSKSMDSDTGTQILNPFVKKGFRVTASAPDFKYIFKGTHAESWFQKLKEGNVNPGEVFLGQNLSNLLRLALLYKFGGAYIEADVVVLKIFSKLRNTIGALNLDPRTGEWSRLNNAVLVFDKKHPLLFKFIQEFALTFDGNKWGHNGPYLILRVVSRVRRNQQEGFEKTKGMVSNVTSPFYL
ncbi:uncharacterized protein At4g19900-like [Arachis ipaensis]|nr:uncharacterized protein At4g19900-like [Arachis ipaensis]